MVDYRRQRGNRWLACMLAKRRINAPSVPQKQYGVDISQLRARWFQPTISIRFDRIFVMDRSNRSNVLALARNEEDRQKVDLFPPTPTDERCGSAGSLVRRRRRLPLVYDLLERASLAFIEKHGQGPKRFDQSCRRITLPFTNFPWRSRPAISQSAVAGCDLTTQILRGGRREIGSQFSKGDPASDAAAGNRDSRIERAYTSGIGRSPASSSP